MEKKYQETTAEEIRKKHAEIRGNNKERSRIENMLEGKNPNFNQ